MGLFGNIFDFNHDGHLDSFEQAAEGAAFLSIIHDCEQDEVLNTLKENGYSADDIDLMDEDELKEAMEDSGLDPDDYE